MKAIAAICFALFTSILFAQQHDLKPAEALQNAAFLKGNWVGQQVFNVAGGQPMKGDAFNRIDDAIGGRYLCEMLSTVLPGRKPTDTRHFLTYDAKASLYRAYWFTDTSVGPMEFEGTVTGHKLVLTTKEGAPNTLRATYESPDANKLIYTLEMKQGDNWVLLFTTTYSKKG